MAFVCCLVSFLNLQDRDSDVHSWEPLVIYSGRFLCVLLRMRLIDSVGMHKHIQKH